MKNTHKCIGNNIRVGVFSQAIVTRYVYYSCGFSEEWVESPYLEVLRQKKP